MKLTIEMPWEKDLTHNHSHFGPGGGYRKKPHVQAWMERLAWEVKIMGLALGVRMMPDTLKAEDGWNPIPIPYQLPLEIMVYFRFPDKRRRDDHNYHKIICDAVAAGLGIDDKDIRISTGTVTVDKANPGFSIEVSDERQDRQLSN
jgi:hypothetical protein